MRLGCRLSAALATTCGAAALGAASAVGAPIAATGSAQNAIIGTNHAAICVNQAGQQVAQAQIGGSDLATATGADLDDATDADMLGPLADVAEPRQPIGY